jgi:hypothetical protein
MVFLSLDCVNGLNISISDRSLDRVFFFHEGAMWSGQHALVYGPIHRLVQIKSAGGAEWKGEEAAEFPKLYGETREMFYKRKGQIYYAGTYRGLQLPDLGSNQFMELGANVRLLHPSTHKIILTVDAGAQPYN